MDSLACTLIISYNRCKYFGELPKDLLRLIIDHIVCGELSRVKKLDKNFFADLVDSSWPNPFQHFLSSSITGVQLDSYFLKIAGVDADLCTLLTHCFRDAVTQIVGARTFLLISIYDLSNLYYTVDTDSVVEDKILADRDEIAVLRIAVAIMLSTRGQSDNFYLYYKYKYYKLLLIPGNPNLRGPTGVMGTYKVSGPTGTTGCAGIYGSIGATGNIEPVSNTDSAGN